MRIGWVGLGKLGSVCASVLQHHGFEVLGYDLQEVTSLPSYEAHIDRLRPVPQSSLRDIVRASDVVFVAVQTPHAPEHSGETVLRPETPPQDFEYTYLVSACRQVFEVAARLSRSLTVVVVSTVLPGTLNRLIRPIKPTNVTLLYNPFFIAMGTTVSDFEAPEFVLIGADDPQDADPLKVIYRQIHDAPCAVVSIESAELTKVAYNTFISLKIVFANTIMEISHKTGADCDQVIDCLSIATDRVVSPAYLRGGMGDGGACHPRDNIAMSWLAQRLNLSTDLMGYVTRARESQSGYLRDLALYWSRITDLPIVLLGLSYKPGSPLVSGSPALLLLEQLEEWDDCDRMVTSYDTYLDRIPTPSSITQQPSVFVITTRHPEFFAYDFAPGSVVIDPHGEMDPSRLSGCQVISVGRKPHPRV